MDAQKFTHISCSTSINEVVYSASLILNDIKNSIGLMQYWGNLIGCNVSKFSDPNAKCLMDEGIREMVLCGARYTEYCQQYKILKKRIDFLRSLTPEKLVNNAENNAA
jgi:hypothetical protein